MAKMVLELHDFRESKPTDESARVVTFLFTLMTQTDRQSGVRAGETNTFWTETRLSRDLAARGAWARLSRADQVKALYSFAVERIQEAGRKVREAPLFWTALSPLKDGPPWNLAQVKFPKPDAVLFEGPSPGATAGTPETRKAAGLSA